MLRGGGEGIIEWFRGKKSNKPPQRPLTEENQKIEDETERQKQEENRLQRESNERRSADVKEFYRSRYQPQRTTNRSRVPTNPLFQY